MKPIESKPGCIKAALAIIGDKWTPLILRDLHTGPKRFNQLQRALVPISPRTLSARLCMLEKEQVVTKKIIPEKMPHTEYALTKKGSDFAHILRQMADWGEKYHRGD